MRGLTCKDLVTDALVLGRGTAKMRCHVWMGILCPGRKMHPGERLHLTVWLVDEASINIGQCEVKVEIHDCEEGKEVD
jgi:hypothetical protein